MTKDERTPDILGALTSKPAKKQAAKKSNHQTSKPAKKQSRKPAKKKDSKPSKRQTVKMQSQRLREYMEGDKVKSTVYLSDETHEDLEFAVLKARQFLPKMLPKDEAKKKRGQVSRSMLIELALQDMLDDLEENGIESRLGKRLAGL